MDKGAEVVWPPEKQRSLLSLSQDIFADPPHSAASLSFSLPFFSHSAVHLSVTSVFSGLHLSVLLWVMGLVIWGS